MLLICHCSKFAYEYDNIQNSLVNRPVSGHSVLNGHLAIPHGSPLNTSLTVEPVTVRTNTTSLEDRIIRFMSRVLSSKVAAFPLHEGDL